MLTIQTLIDDLATGCKPKSGFRLGIEHEQFAFDLASGAPLAYEGMPGIRALLESFAAAHGWQPYLEDGHPIALSKKTPNGEKIFSLEPGGQVEFSGAPCATAAEAVAEMEDFYAKLAPVAAKLGIGLLRCGFHPRWTREDVHWMPKERYAIMRAYMPRVGAKGLDMMLRTCGSQLNVDFASEADMVRKFRVTLALQPAINALMANSCMAEGKDTGYASWRSAVWQDTDPARSGFLPFVFEKDFGFARYVDYALSVPMYFFRREGRHIGAAGLSFRDFMEGRLPGHEDETATLADWHDHLTTLFPAVRLKHYLELRGPDSTAPEMVAAMTAFWTGILYDDAALAEAARIAATWPGENYLRLQQACAKDGLDTAMDGLGPWTTLADFAGDMLHLAHGGLSRHEPGAQPLLAPFEARLGSAGAKNCVGL
jgi:glutamate--cysteine ligase